MRKRIVVISGGSGSGKTSLVREILKESQGELVKSVTTRESRGKDDYYFHVSEEEFEHYPGEFIETNYYNGYHYATPLTEVKRILEEGKQAILDIDVNGYRQIKEKAENLGVDVIGIFILAEPKEIYKRLLKRKTESIESIIARMETSLSEIESVGIYDAVLWNNDSVKETVKEIIRVINGDIPEYSNERIKEWGAEMKSLLKKISD